MGIHVRLIIHPNPTSNTFHETYLLAHLYGRALVVRLNCLAHSQPTWASEFSMTNPSDRAKRTQRQIDHDIGYLFLAGGRVLEGYIVAAFDLYSHLLKQNCQWLFISLTNKWGHGLEMNLSTSDLDTWFNNKRQRYWWLPKQTYTGGD
jgi:hypothetical protein